MVKGPETLVLCRKLERLHRGGKGDDIRNLSRPISMHMLACLIKPRNKPFGIF